MLPLNDFILLKAIYNESLHNAVLLKDNARIEAIVHERYSFELKNGFVSMEAIDTDRLYKEHMEQINDEELMQRMI
jgi:hypothetical protein